MDSEEPLCHFLGHHANRHPVNGQAAREVIDDYLAHLDTLRESGAAVAGIVDRPRGAGVVRLLHLNSLEPGKINDDSLRDLGCYRRVTDRLLFQTLRPGERSAVFDNASPPNREHYTGRGHNLRFAAGFQRIAPRSGKADS